MKHLHRAREYKALTEATARRWLKAQGVDVDAEFTLLLEALGFCHWNYETAFLTEVFQRFEVFQRPETWRLLYAECPWCKRPMQRVVVPPQIAFWLCLPCNEQNRNRDFWL